ncbi:hypothetical protein XmelCFBP4644_07680 [Xanthomonas melonis]|uniref:Uncharacterized protein n=1 Tax=Xanthomonas melonis TaxID=56456 RepID=A0A2S7DHU0_9XANT|nr:hypothetical protein XmelCFBP4644_07680 [Xanthomonas melonis]
MGCGATDAARRRRAFASRCNGEADLADSPMPQSMPACAAVMERPAYADVRRASFLPHVRSRGRRVCVPNSLP